MIEATAATIGSDFAVIDASSRRRAPHDRPFHYRSRARSVRNPAAATVIAGAETVAVQHSRKAEDAAGKLTGFMDEEVATGCAHWAATTLRGSDRVFELAPYGLRRRNDAEHRRLLKAAGRHGWWGLIQEDDDPPDTPASRKRARLATLPLTYPEVGATGTSYHTVDVAQPIGTGRAWFDVAVQLQPRPRPRQARGRLTH